MARSLVRAALTALALGAACSSNPTAQPDGGSCATGCGSGLYCCQKTATCEQVKHNCVNVQSCGPGFELTYPSPPYMDEASCEPIPLQCTCKASDALSPGPIGRHSALAVANGSLLASAYESDFGDLVLATVKLDALDTPSYEIVDGVPDKPATRPTTSWRGGVEDAGDDVGLDTDLKISAAGDPLISYRDATNRTLKLALRSGGKWSKHVVEAPKGDKEVVGRYSSLLLLEGKPAIAYLALNISDGSGGFRSELRWATASSATPAAAADWTVTVIDKAAMSCQSLCSSSEVCVVKADGSSSCQTKGTGCSPACGTDQACVGGACKTILADQKYVDVPLANGLWPTAVSTTSGPVVVYYDRRAGRLKGATPSGGAWKTAVLRGSGSEDVGAFATALSDGKSTVHVTYQDAARLTLHYVHVDASTLAASSAEVIDDGLRSDGQHPVGADSALVLDGAGNLRVIYQDALKSDLLQATRSSPGQWTPNIAADADLGRALKTGPKAYGFYSALVTDGGKVYGSTFYYDAQGVPKGALSFFKLP